MEEIADVPYQISKGLRILKYALALGAVILFVGGAVVMGLLIQHLRGVTGGCAAVTQLPKFDGAVLAMARDGQKLDVLTQTAGGGAPVLYSYDLCTGVLKTKVAFE